MRLSKNFVLEEFLVSQTAERHGIDMTPPPEVIENLQVLVHSCMQPLRDDVGSPIFISSGWRPLELNIMIGGSTSSEHVNGNAVDFIVVRQTPFDTCELIVAMDLPFDQVILEFFRWVHLGIRDTLRSQKLTAHHKDGRTIYTPGIVKLEDLT